MFPRTDIHFPKSGRSKFSVIADVTAMLGDKNLEGQFFPYEIYGDV